MRKKLFTWDTRVTRFEVRGQLRRTGLYVFHPDLRNVELTGRFPRTHLICKALQHILASDTQGERMQLAITPDALITGSEIGRQLERARLDVTPHDLSDVVLT